MQSHDFETVPKAYAEILFLDKLFVGLLLLVVTFWFPNIGLCGFIAALVAYATAKIMHFPNTYCSIYIFNSLLVGLSLGAFYKFDTTIFLFLVFAAILTVLLTVSVSDFLHHYNQLPALSLPFIIIAFIMALVARTYPDLTSNMDLLVLPESLMQPEWLNSFFSSLGAIFFTPQPWVGILLFTAILISSRYLALLALCGFLVGYSILAAFDINEFRPLIIWTGFNFVLVALALGGFYTIPSLIGFTYAMLAVILTALVALAVKNLLIVYGLPVMALPFVIITLIFLVALKNRSLQSKPVLAQPPGYPEVNYERARLAQFRNGGIDSVPLLLPFFGEWQIYQGFDGEHTHKSQWRHALDFFILEDGVSFKGKGTQLEDYYCYGLPVVSPVFGEVARIYDHLADNKPGDVDAENNWGNFVLIRLQSGKHVMLAHLAHESIKVKEGDYIKPGDELAQCGNSGRSPQPHLHLQVQEDARLGSPTCNFHLASVIVSKSKKPSQYKLVVIPEEGDSISPASDESSFAKHLHLPVGRTFCYQWEHEHKTKETELSVELTLLNQFRLKSQSGASSAFQERNGVIAFYDRLGKKDTFFDMWVLANGLTPLSDKAVLWQDAPSAKLLPLNRIQHMIMALLRPLGCGLRSQYERSWDEEKQVWLQRGYHQLNLGIVHWKAKTVAIIDPDEGITHVELEFNRKKWQAKLTDTGLKSDQGIPGWRETSLGTHIERR